MGKGRAANVRQEGKGNDKADTAYLRLAITRKKGGIPKGKESCQAGMLNAGYGKGGKKGGQPLLVKQPGGMYKEIMPAGGKG